MKSKIQMLFVALGMLPMVYQTQSIPIFPVVTNGLAGGFASSGSNVLVAILSGTNVSFQLSKASRAHARARPVAY